MEGYKMPLFKQGSVLTKDMLECLKDYEVEFSTALYSDYANGIIRGCQIQGEKGILYIKKGLILYEGCILHISEKVLTPPNSNAWHAIKIYVRSFNEETNYQQRKIDIAVTEQLEKENDAIEVCRIRLQQGATIRSTYRDFADVNTEFDTVNIVEAQWASFEQESVSPYLLKAFANDMMKSQLSNPIDITFVQSIMSIKGETIPRQQIQFYISSRLGKEYEELTNKDIYQKLGEILRMAKTGRVVEKRERMERRIIVD